MARRTIAQILERHGLDPAPERNRKTTGKEFLARHGVLVKWAPSPGETTAVLSHLD